MMLEFHFNKTNLSNLTIQSLILLLLIDFARFEYEECYENNTIKYRGISVSKLEYKLGDLGSRMELSYECKFVIEFADRCEDSSDAASELHEPSDWR